MLGLGISGVTAGLYGRTLATFGLRSERLLPPNKFSSGDIVRAVAQHSPPPAAGERELSGARVSGTARLPAARADHAPTGRTRAQVVTKTSDKSVSVAFDGDVDDERLLALRSADGGAVRLDVLPNDASHRKVLRALASQLNPRAGEVCRARSD